jgi:hypothetical protein
MQIPKRPTGPRAVTVDEFVRRARPDWNGLQIIAFDPGPPRFELLMTWDDRGSAVEKARWALGFDRAGIGMREIGGEFMVTDTFERIRDRGQVVIRHTDLVTGMERIERLAVPADPDRALSLGMIHVRDYYDLHRAKAVLATDRLAVVPRIDGDRREPAEPVDLARALIARITGKSATRPDV